MPRLLAFILLILVGPFLAEARAQDNALVYWPLVTDGSEYRRVAYPPEAGPLVVMADTEIVLDARRARVTYWPITREYLADVSSGSAVQTGTLEIAAEDGTITRVSPKPYVIWHPEGVGAGPTHLVHGEAATEVHNTFVREGRAAAEALREYQRLVAEHRAAVEAWLKIAATRPAVLPPPPPEFTLAEPEPYRAFATEPEPGQVVSLPAGRYKVRQLGDDGRVIPGSERDLISFAALSQGVGYVVRPGDRWTQPVVSLAPNETIYTTGGTDLYVQPVRVAEYVAQDYARLFRPQTREIADPYLTLWVPAPQRTAQTQSARLKVWDGRERSATLDTSAFRVTQLPGRSLGYEIETFSPAEGSQLRPDFSAMKIGRDLAHTHIGLVGDGALQATDRALLRISPAGTAWMFLPALLPIAIGVALRLWRRRPRQRPAYSAPIPAAPLAR